VVKEVAPAAMIEENKRLRAEAQKLKEI